MDILFSIGLMIFSIYCFVLVGLESPAPTPTELGAAFWPRIILVLMIILLVYNLYSDIKNKKTVEKINIGAFFKSKLFVGMILVAAMTIIMPYVGFITSCFLFLVSYGYLLGERKIVKLLIFSFIITMFLYFVFQGMLDIRLERGYGFFRDIALSLETLILNIRRGF